MLGLTQAMHVERESSAFTKHTLRTMLDPVCTCRTLCRMCGYGGKRASESGQRRGLPLEVAGPGGPILSTSAEIAVLQQGSQLFCRQNKTERLTLKAGKAERCRASKENQNYAQAIADTGKRT